MSLVPDNFQKFAELSSQFLNKIDSYMQASEMKLASYWNVDHLCWRSSSIENYQASCKSILNYSKKLTEADVNGRPISVFELSKPIIWNQHLIYVVEIPAPKPQKQSADGFEHIEVVIDERFVDLEKKWGHCHWNKRGLEKNINPELEIVFDDAAIKFHHCSLKSVIQLENNAPVFDAITELKIIEQLKPYEPLIVGTFPLNIHTEESDVDILLHTEDFEVAHRKIHPLIKNYPDFSYKMNTYRNVKFVVYGFTHNQVPFELYLQNKPTVKQYGFRHFFLEERLLQLATEDWRKKIIQFRSDGLKTEPSFAQLLNLTGDPYESLLSLYNKSDLELSQLVKNGN